MLTAVLGVAVLGSAVMVAYLVAGPRPGAGFTEFYLIGAEGTAAAYPERLVKGQEGQVTAGIVNREHETVSYRIVVRIGAGTGPWVGPVRLAHAERWQGLVTFVPRISGDDQMVEFLLFRNDEAEPYLALHLVVDVAEPSAVR